MIISRLKRTAHRMLQMQRALPTYLHWRRKLRRDSLFQLANVDEGLAPRPTAPTRTAEQRLELAERLIDAYRSASADLSRQPDVYKVSNEWIPIFRRPLLPLIDALDRGSARDLRDLLDNFFRSEISQGLIGLATNMADTFFDRQPSHYMRTQLLIDSVYRYRLLERLLPGTTPSDLHIDDFGNPYGMVVDGAFLRTGCDYQYYYAHRVAELLDVTGEKAAVAELGGGIGGFAYFLNKARPTGLTYVNLDLPEILCISSYQLMNLFPDKRALLYGEISDINSASIAAHDMALLPSFVIEGLEIDSVDVSFNSYSLAEMDSPTIQNYAHHLSRITRKAILHVNHVSDAVVSADRFVFDMGKFDLTSRTRALWNLGRDLECDEFEFLLTRRR